MGGGFAAVLFALLSFDAWARRWIFRVVTRQLWTNFFHSKNTFTYGFGSPCGRKRPEKWTKKGELGSLVLTTSRTFVSCHTKLWQSSASSPFETHHLSILYNRNFRITNRNAGFGEGIESVQCRKNIAFGSESGHSSTNVQSLSLHEPQIAKVCFWVALP